MFQSGESVYLPGSSGEPTALVAALFATPNVAVTTSFVPGINDLTGKTFGEGVGLTGFFMQPGLASAQRARAFRHLPFTYGAVAKWLDESPPFECCVIQVTPPDAHGVCSLGPAAEFTPIAMRRARRVIAVVNPNVPFIPNAPRIALAACALHVEADTPLIGYDTGPGDEAADKIASHVASFIEDGSVLQLGLGKVPAGILAKLGDRRGLSFHSGMLSDSLMALQASGALDPDKAHKTTVLLGSPLLYRWAENRSDLHVLPCDKIHDPMVLSSIERLIAINSALEIDLFGQANLELASGRAVSGVGGAMDFAHAARLSRGGLSIIALPSSFGNAKGSRIKPWLGGDALASIPRTDIDVIVTEEGIADLRGRSVHERAEAIIEIAGKSFRDELRESWKIIRERL